MFKNLEDLWNFFIFFLKIFMKFEAKKLSPVAFHALICVEVSVSIKCFDWSKMAAEVFPVARIDEYAKPCEPAIHVLRSVTMTRGLKNKKGNRSDSHWHLYKRVHGLCLGSDRLAARGSPNVKYSLASILARLRVSLWPVTSTHG